MFLVDLIVKKFFMCKCTEPNYTVRKQSLYCKNCNKPVLWSRETQGKVVTNGEDPKES